MEIFLVLVWFASACFCAQLADEKGYSSLNWCILGFLFGFFALIAVAGLPDRKLRKYMRQIGEKQKAIEKVSESEGSNEKITIQFVMPSGANKLQLFNKLKSEIKNNEKIQQRFDELKFNSYELNDNLLGGKEFSLLAEDLRTIFVLKGKKLNNIQTQWTGEF